MAVFFRIVARDPASGARRGLLSTPHGDVETPAFLPVGTHGSVKGVLPDQLREMGYSCILANTYHLYLRPGHERIRRLGGLHRFAGWAGAILTDSGGFQVFSLRALRRVTDEGVLFRSHLDGSSHLLTPELAVRIQEALGSDIRMVLDEPASDPADRRRAENAVRRTTAWAARCRAAAGSGAGSLFGIVQGGIFADLRRRSVEEVCAVGFPGYAIGGVSVGERKELQRRAVDVTAPLLPAENPRYLMGMGTPDDVLFAVARGVDLFDCVLPTRNARNGMMFTSAGPLSIKQARYADDPGPPDERCACPTCRRFCRAFLRHLFVRGDIQAAMLMTLHNLHFYARLMAGIRESILRGNFAEFMKEFVGSGAEQHPSGGTRC